MRFHISRRSTYNKKPCREARKHTYVWTDWRTASDPAKIPAYLGQDTSWWYDEGRNHRVEKGMIGRDFDRKGWFVDMPVAGIYAFSIKHGAIIVCGPTNESEYPSIEIDD